jgi:hypothetical protein
MSWTLTAATNIQNVCLQLYVTQYLNLHFPGLQNAWGIMKDVVYEHKLSRHVQLLSVIPYYSKCVYHIQNILTFPTHSSVTTEICAHVNITFFTHNDLKNYLLML